MTPIPIYVLVGATAGLGLYLGFNYLRRVKTRVEIVGLHFLLGAASLEPAAIVLHGGMSASGAKPPLFGLLTALFIALALLSGVTAAIVGRTSRKVANVAISGHALTALSAVVLMLAWAFRL